MNPNITEAIGFMERLYPVGPWVFSAIELDGHSILTKTFYPTENTDIQNWITAQQNEKRNIYFQINPYAELDAEKKERVFKRPKREAIKELIVFHVDVDPRAGEDLTSEQARILELVGKQVDGVPLPSISVWSGGGAQLYWLLKDPPQGDGTVEKAEELKRYNMQLELLYGADGCHNIDRIGRLPGTVNYPDKAKRKKGRIVCQSKVMEYHEDRVYPVSEFVQSAVVQGAGRQTGSARATFDTGKVVRCLDLDTLGGVADWVKSMIVHGYETNGANEHLSAIGVDPHKYDSRSEAVWAVVCHLVKANVEDEMVFAILTDTDYRISDHLFDQKVGAEKYALRQILNAHEHAVDPILRELNDNHCVIADMGGLCRIVSEVWDPVMKRHRLTVASFQDFRNRYCHRKVSIGTDKDNNEIWLQAGKWWIEHPMREQRTTMVFAPGREVPDAYNIWTGFTCEARKGDCSLYLKHILDNICSGIDHHYEYTLNWMARTVQKPDRPGQIAIILKGRQGTGKSYFVKAFGNLFGRHFLQVSDAKHLIGQFNAHLRDCVVLFGDEAFYAGDKRHESTLKTLVTEEFMAVEAKGVDVVASHNFTHILLASNSEWVVPANSDERRYFVLDVNDDQMQNPKYFTKMIDQMDNGGNEALLHLLMTRDISKFRVRDVPKTSALQDQKMLSMSTEQEWWYDRLLEGTQLLGTEQWLEEVPKSEIFSEYLEYAKQISSQRPLNKTTFGKFLQRMCPGHFPLGLQKKVKQTKGRDESFSRPWFYVFPTNAECRKFFDQRHGGPYKWTAGVQKQEEF